MVGRLIAFLEKAEYCNSIYKNQLFFKFREKKFGFTVIFYLLFYFLFVAHINAGLENSNECDVPCQRKTKGTPSKKKSINPKKISLEPKIQQEIPTDINALKDSLKKRMIYGQSVKGKLDQIKSMTAQEIESQGLREIKTIPETHFKTIQSEINNARQTQKDESFLLNDINEKLKWKEK